MRIDSHQHFWQLQRGDYGWLDESLGVLYRDYQPTELAGHLAAGSISKSIVVQAAATVEESKYLLALAEEFDFIAGVVGWIDMDGDNALPQLAGLAAHDKLLGIRPMIQDIADPEWMLQPALDPIFRQLIGRQLCFDALVKPGQLDNLTVLLRRYPDLRVVIDHAAKPNIAEGEFEPWAAKMQTIASETQAYCKLSGLLTEAADGATMSDLQPYMQHLLECFGAERLMWGSDWPVLNLAADYAGWLSISEQFISVLPDGDQQAIMGHTAAQFYQL
ncbi:MAG: amidohydrolase family protein [Pseudomonadales bacterium]